MLSLMNIGVSYDLVKMFFKDVRVELLCWIIDFFFGVKVLILKNCILSERDVFFLKRMYNVLYLNIEESRIIVCNICRFIKYVDIFGLVLGIKLGRSNRFLLINVYWYKDDGQICDYEEMGLVFRLG